jgi:hypothetical protein
MSNAQPLCFEEAFVENDYYVTGTNRFNMLDIEQFNLQRRTKNSPVPLALDDRLVPVVASPRRWQD